MGEGVGHEIARGGDVDQIRDGLCGRKQDHRVVKYRRAAVEHLVGGDAFSVGGGEAADFRRDQLEGRLLLLDRRYQGVEKRAVRAVRRQYPELAALETLRPTLDDAEGRRRVEVLAGGNGRIRRLRHRLQAEGVADLFPQGFIDVEKMRDHPLADHRRLHLAQFEGQGVGDVALLGRRLADEELPGLAVMVGKALGADAQLGPLLLGRKWRKPFMGDSRGPSPQELGW